MKLLTAVLHGCRTARQRLQILNTTSSSDVTREDDSSDDDWNTSDGDRAVECADRAVLNLAHYKTLSVVAASRRSCLFIFSKLYTFVGDSTPPWAIHGLWRNNFTPGTDDDPREKDRTPLLGVHRCLWSVTAYQHFQPPRKSRDQPPRPVAYLPPMTSAKGLSPPPPSVICSRRDCEISKVVRLKGRAGPTGCHDRYRFTDLQYLLHAPTGQDTRREICPPRRAALAGHAAHLASTLSRCPRELGGPRSRSGQTTCPTPRRTRFRFPSRSLPDFSRVGTVPDDAAGISHSPTLAFRRCSVLTSLTLIGSQDLDVKGRTNLSNYTQGSWRERQSSERTSITCTSPWTVCKRECSTRLMELSRPGRHEQRGCKSFGDDLAGVATAREVCSGRRQGEISPPFVPGVAVLSWSHNITTNSTRQHWHDEISVAANEKRSHCDASLTRSYPRQPDKSSSDVVSVGLSYRVRRGIVTPALREGFSDIASHSEYHCDVQCSEVPTRLWNVRSPTGLLLDFRTWESCVTMSLARGFSHGAPVSPALAFRRCSIPRFTPIGPQDHDVTTHPNLPTQFFFISPD
ncbi:hypothetical protein PR048_022961 [Dryococelus australis]|uniref:Uncharacterized protein n=1 Tax=Dryococelus australis TaxID=614101 RepID=A0ABQ9GSQ9_9NEOP|nr:hypothetical protein PR048_022961 [Dryococelus australis]